MLRFEFAVVADLTANVLSVCLVVFLTLLPLTGNGRREASGPPRAETLFQLAERRPLSGPAMVAALHGRRADPAQRSLDLFADRLEFVAGDAPPRVLPVEELATLPGPVTLFVLDPALHSRVLRSLGGGARIAAEMSVPDALRDPAGPRVGWSSDFRRLDAAPRARSAFDAELARILRAAPPRVAAEAGAAGAEASVTSSADRLLDRLANAATLSVALGLPLAAMIGLGTVELRRRRRMLDPVPYGMEADTDPR